MLNLWRGVYIKMHLASKTLSLSFCTTKTIIHCLIDQHLPVTWNRCVSNLLSIEDKGYVQIYWYNDYQILGNSGSISLSLLTQRKSLLLTTPSHKQNNMKFANACALVNKHWKFNNTNMTSLCDSAISGLFVMIKTRTVPQILMTYNTSHTQT